MRIWQQRGLRLFEHGNRQIATDGREVIQEDFQRITGLKVIEQSLDGNSCAGKNRSATVDFRINSDEALVHNRTPASIRCSSIAGMGGLPVPNVLLSGALPFLPRARVQQVVGQYSVEN